MSISEIHTAVTEEYGRLMRIRTKANLPRIGLTATPDDHKDDKDIFYKTYCPIIYKYLNSAQDGIVNKRRYFIYEYELSDIYQVMAGTKKNPFMMGEKSQYEYLTKSLKKGQVMMSRTESQDWFRDAANWAWNNQGTPAQKAAAIQYLNAIKYRKEFLWNLTSSTNIVDEIKHLILRDKNNKVLLFSELTKQAEKLSKYTVHSNNSEDVNSANLSNFDNGTIRELASCNSLTLGLNIKGANYAIMESYSGSSTGFIQKAGRTDRLNIDMIATVIFIVPKGTQAEQWFNNATKLLNLSDAVYVKSINQLKQLL